MPGISGLVDRRGVDRPDHDAEQLRKLVEVGATEDRAQTRERDVGDRGLLVDRGCRGFGSVRIFGKRMTRPRRPTRSCTKKGQERSAMAERIEQ